MCSQGVSQFYLHTHTFIRNRNEPLPSQPQLVLIYRPWRDGRLSRPWCEVAQAEIRTRDLPIANPALYHTATSAHYLLHHLSWQILFTTKLLEFFVLGWTLYAASRAAMVSAGQKRQLFSEVLQA